MPQRTQRELRDLCGTSVFSAVISFTQLLNQRKKINTEVAKKGQRTRSLTEHSFLPVDEKPAEEEIEDNSCGAGAPEYFRR